MSSERKLPRKSGKGGSAIPYSTLSNLMLGMVRSFSSAKRQRQDVERRYTKAGRPVPPWGRDQLFVYDRVLEALSSLDGVCRGEDVVQVAKALEALCANSEWSRELDDDVQGS